MSGQGSGGNVLAALASFFIPGLGQLLQGRLLMAIIHFCLAAVFIHCFFHFILILLWLMPYDFIFRLRAALYISTIHFIIDVSRVRVEEFLYDKKDFTVLKRKDVISYLAGNRNAESGPFMKKYLKRWIFINIADQGLHLAVISGFVLFN